MPYVSDPYARMILGRFLNGHIILDCEGDRAAFDMLMRILRNEGVIWLGGTPADMMHFSPVRQYIWHLHRTVCKNTRHVRALSRETGTREMLRLNPTAAIWSVRDMLYILCECEECGEEKGPLNLAAIYSA